MKFLKRTHHRDIEYLQGSLLASCSSNAPSVLVPPYERPRVGGANVRKQKVPSSNSKLAVMKKVTSSNSLALTAKVARSNLTLLMPSRSRSVLREQALAPWRFQPSDTAKVLPARHGNRNKDFPGLPAWIMKASQRDMEIVTRALMAELDSRADEGALTRTLNKKNVVPFTSEIVSSSTSSCDLGSPSRALPNKRQAQAWKSEIRWQTSLRLLGFERRPCQNHVIIGDPLRPLIISYANSRREGKTELLSQL